MAPPNDAEPLSAGKNDGGVAGRNRSANASLQPNLGALIHDVARLIRRGFERRARQTGLPFTRHQARVLLSIARHEGASQVAVAAMLDIEPIALVRMLDRLHDEGLVERRLHPTDRRVRTLWLTAAGWAALDRILAINHQVREEACAGMSASERQALLRALRQMKDNLLLTEDVPNGETRDASRAAGEARGDVRSPSVA